MLKIPRGAAYLVLIALLAAAVYMVTAAGGIEGLLSAANWRAAEESPGADEDTVEASDDPADWDLDTDRQYFIEYRLERERARSKELDLLQQMINNPNITQDSKSEAEKRLLELQGIIEVELLVENAIKAQGFTNAVLIMQKDAALVIVEAKELTSQQIILIAQLTSQATGLRASQISISNQAGK
mgnify:CR=1 FL=1